jgi:MFS family permease
LAATTSFGGPPGARRLALEGAFQSLAQGLGEAYLGAYALLLGAGGLALGLVATLPTAATAAAQVLARRALTRAGGARRLLARSWSAQAIGYLALGLCLLASYPWSVVALVTVALFAWGCGGIAVPAWTSLVSNLVPPSRHGWFFGLRGAAQACGVLTAILSGGALLSILTARGHEALGFVLIFAYAALGRVFGSALLARLPEPARAEPGRPRPVELKPIRSSRKFRRLSIYLWSLHLATHVSSPFFVPYMLRELRFSYLLVGALIATPAIVKVATLGIWGRLADRLGPGPVLRTTGWLVAPVPALWLVSRSPWWILAAQVYSGLVWGAFELAQASSILQTTRARERQVAWFNAVDGGVLIAGSLIGGTVVNLVSGRGGQGYLTAMGLSTLLRLLPAVGILWRLRGIGRPAWSHLMMPLRVWTVRPTRGLTLRVWEGFRLTGFRPARSWPGRAVPGAARRGRPTSGIIEGSAAVEPETGRPVPSVLESPPRAAG